MLNPFISMFRKHFEDYLAVIGKTATTTPRRAEETFRKGVRLYVRVW